MFDLTSPGKQEMILCRFAYARQNVAQFPLGDPK